MPLIIWEIQLTRCMKWLKKLDIVLSIILVRPLKRLLGYLLLLTRRGEDEKVKRISRFWMFAFIVSLVILMGLIYFIRYDHVQGENQGTPYVIGVSQSNLTEPWRVQMNAEIRKEAQKHKGLQVIYTDAAESIEKQKKDINKLIGYGIDLLIVSTNDTNGLTPLLASVHKKIPVIVLGRAINGYDYTLFI